MEKFEFFAAGVLIGWAAIWVISKFGIKTGYTKAAYTKSFDGAPKVIKKPMAKKKPKANDDAWAVAAEKKSKASQERPMN